MKWILPITIACLALLTKGDVKAQGNPTPPCRAGTLDLRANYWGSGINPASGPGYPVGSCSDCGADPCKWAGTSELDSYNITYEASTATDSIATVPFDISILGTLDCYPQSGYVTKKAGARPASVQQSGSTCKQLYNEEQSYSINQLWQMCYDTGMAYIDQCPNDANSPNAFLPMTGAVQQLGNTDVLRAQYLAWLKSVLYLNTTNPEYFCSCVEAIAGALPAPQDTTPGYVSRGTNIPLAVIAWLLRNTTCDPSALWDQYEASRRTQYQQWVNDTNAYKLDTTLPSMADLGLDTLLNEHFQYVSGVPPDNFNEIVPSFGVSVNPFTKETALWFDLSQSSYIGIQVFDVSGRPVIGDGSGIVYNPGAHNLPLDLSDYPAGSYFLRIALGTGEVRTIKLIKE